MSMPKFVNWLNKHLSAYKGIYAVGRFGFRSIQRLLQLLRVSWLSPEHYVKQLHKMCVRDWKMVTPIDEASTVLVFTVRGWRMEIHNLWEFLIGKGLEYRGWKVITYLCGGWLPYCDSTEPNLIETPKSLCHNCISIPKQILKDLGLSVMELKDFVNPEEVQSARELVASMNPSELPKVTIEGVPVGQLVKPSVHRALRQDSIDNDLVDLALYRAYIASGIVMVKVLNRLLDKIQPKRIFMFNGLFFAEYILMWLAKQHHIPVVTYEASPYHRNCLEIAMNSAVAKRDYHRDWELYREQPLLATERKRLEAFIKERRKGKVGRGPFWSSMTTNPQQIIKQLGLNPHKPIATFYTSTLGDTSGFETNRAFPSQEKCVLETIRHFAKRLNVQLVLRIHPGEVRFGWQLRTPMLTRIKANFPKLPDNVVIVGPDSDFSSYTLLDISQVVLTYLSTIGLEAAIYGKTVIVAGKAHYSGKGFTIDVDDAAHYGQLIDAAFAKPGLELAIKELAWRFGYFYFFRFPIPFPLVTYGHWIALNFKSLSALAPGGNKELDLICRFITESTCDDRSNLLEQEFKNVVP